jgi:ribonuclease HIII
MKKNNKPSFFTAKIDISLKDKLVKDLQQQGFDLTQPQYTIFSAKKKGITCVLYQSGKLLIQGKEKDSFIEFYIEPEILQNFNYSYPEINVDFTSRIGVDEAGKGDFFGPLCIAGVYANKADIQKLLDMGVADSKKLSDKKIIKLAPDIKKMSHTIIRLFPQKYNELYSKFRNLNSLLGWAHATTITDLQGKTGSAKAIIDQFASKDVVLNALSKKDVTIELVQRHRGEEDVVVAAASILARHSFLEGMDILSQDISFTLPKGASSLVIDAGVKLLHKGGISLLDKVSKTHFKTRQDILNKME